jgi:hypothetical protein
MKEGILEFHPGVEPLAYITLSRFTALKGCALKEVWGANRVPRLLPSAPAGRLGSATHRLLQEAGEGHFRSEVGASVDRRWQELIGDAHNTMRRSWLERHLVPLERSVPDYEVRRLRARERALEITAAASRTPERGLSKSPGELPRACYELGRKSHRNADSTVGLVPSRSTFPAFLSRF